MEKIISISNDYFIYSSEFPDVVMRVQTSGFWADPVVSQHLEVRLSPYFHSLTVRRESENFQVA